MSKATDNESDIFDTADVREIFEEIVDDRSPDGLLNPLSDLLERFQNFQNWEFWDFDKKILSRAARVDGPELEDSICKFMFLYFPFFDILQPARVDGAELEQSLAASLWDELEDEEGGDGADDPVEEEEEVEAERVDDGGHLGICS